MNEDLVVSRLHRSDSLGIPHAKWLQPVEWLLLLLIFASVGLRTLPAAWKTLNTDFPNYYLTARLAREKHSTSRIYEWVWLQRQKDHYEIDRPIISLVPITPFSTLATWPIAGFSPLIAKRLWLVINLFLLAATCALLRALTDLSLRRVLLVTALSAPLGKNFLFGQYYLLLLFVLTLACWCYVHQKRFVSGLLIGSGFGLKLFPLLYLGYFLRKRDTRAFTGGIIGSLLAVAVSVGFFGWQAHRVLFSQVLPWTFRGEGMDPYNASTGSLSTLLHRLFVFEPSWNPSPTIHAPWVCALLLPLVQTLLFAPAILLARPGDSRTKRVHLEWSALLIGSLAISTLPASYHFTLLILPVCLMWNVFRERRHFAAIGILLALYVAIGYPGLERIGLASGLALFSVPRLYLLVLLCVVSYTLLATEPGSSSNPRDTRLWAYAFLVFMLFNIVSGLRHQRGLYSDYRWRIPTEGNLLQADYPALQNSSVLFTAMTPEGYRTATQNGSAIQLDKADEDQLALSATSSERWTEKVAKESTIVSTSVGREEIRRAELPVASPDGRWLAFLREEHGRGRLWLRSLDQPGSADRILTSSDLDVLEMSFLPNGSLIFSAEPGGDRPRLFLVDRAGAISSLGTDEVRYPEVSPDGHWFAFSRLQGGNWHLWLRDLRSGQTTRLTDADCNNAEPAWESDSKTLIYASDCGRALWFYALCRRPIS